MLPYYLLSYTLFSILVPFGKYKRSEVVKILVWSLGCPSQTVERSNGLGSFVSEIVWKEDPEYHYQWDVGQPNTGSRPLMGPGIRPANRPPGLNSSQTQHVTPYTVPDWLIGGTWHAAARVIGLPTPTGLMLFYSLPSRLYINHHIALAPVSPVSGTTWPCSCSFIGLLCEDMAV